MKAAVNPEWSAVGATADAPDCSGGGSLVFPGPDAACGVMWSRCWPIPTAAWRTCCDAHWRHRHEPIDQPCAAAASLAHGRVAPQAKVQGLCAFRSGLAIHQPRVARFLEQHNPAPSMRRSVIVGTGQLLQCVHHKRMDQSGQRNRNSHRKGSAGLNCQPLRPLQPGDHP